MAPVAPGAPQGTDKLLSFAMPDTPVRPAAVAGTWYPGRPDALTAEIDRYLGHAGETPAGELIALIAPHAGLMFSGPVGAWSYAAARGRRFDVAVLIGPSHYVGFDGVAAYERGRFATPLGDLAIDEGTTAAIMAATSVVKALREPHAREHSLEMQLPFLRRVLPDVPIVPLLMGFQTRATIEDLASALVRTLTGRRALLIASTDLSHYFDARTAAELDGRFTEAVRRFDVDGLFVEFESYPEHERGRYVGCGAGPALAVLRAASRLGARQTRILKYGNSGDVSGDYGGVVGYLSAAIGNFEA
jgi:AmmeMemoRadiSam system protein B